MVVLAAFAGVAATLDPVHGYGQGLVRLAADRAQGHGAGREAPDDILRRLHFFDGNGPRLVYLEVKEAADGREPAALVVDEVGELLEALEVVGLGGVLKLGDRVRVVHVVLAVTAPLDVAALAQVRVPSDAARRVGKTMPSARLGLQLLDADATDRRRRPAEVLVDKVLAQADRLEYLRPTIALQC